ncbi:MULTISPECIES: NAD(P)-dependent oxidoreductase [unclassified Haladaptatus]|uniref:NAD-dependent epimerase/dehydratase family protein n=1 Tax=unclassified Haladaptatus TaxID=2622732 RepID=UPI00209C27F7|nr:MULTISPECIES: NAD(P)-dependent oxidoreductase [unclassified Haladaptatus]MCO8244780.1 NAD(P)-dependent oxidoreductase [Haladaptatus sp. AB643]MCO8255708.1 NAD(P)-dependent oxidoreductase [Haladaptatus sp. AB618]
MRQSEQTTDVPTIAVTGAAGFIGSRVVNRIQATHPEWNVIALDNFYLGTVHTIGNVDVQHVDIRNRNRLESTLEGADIVMHLAAISGVDDCDSDRDLAYDVNTRGTANVAWFCRKNGTGLIFPFSMAVLGDPESFPITADLPRDPMNWYGRTKLIGEHTIEDMASDAFPAHLFLKSNLYGEHEIDGRTISKGTVINLFVNWVFSDQQLTVYEPGTQSRNYVHVKDVARAYVRSAEVMLNELAAGETGTRRYEIASREDPSVLEVGKLVAQIASTEADIHKEVVLIENPRSSETLTPDFAVDTSKTHNELGWEVKHSVEESIRELIRKKI